MRSAKIFFVSALLCVALDACKQEEIFIYTVNISAYDPGVNVPLNKISFANSSLGFIITSNGKVLKTTDQGATWTISMPGSASLDLRSLCTPAPQAIYVSGEESTNGRFYKSIDSGATWITMIGNYDFDLTDFPSANTGYMISNGDLYKTTNGGGMWNFVNSLGVIFDPQVLAFASDDTGMVVGFDSDSHLTTNGGSSLTQIYGVGFGNGKKIVDIKFISSSVGYAIDYQGGILATYDAGQTWTGLRSSSDAVGEDYGTYAIDAYGSTICAAGDQTLLISKDGGASFHNYSDQNGITILDLLTDVAVVAANKIIATGESGKIYTITF